MDINERLNEEIPRVRSGRVPSARNRGQPPPSMERAHQPRRSLNPIPAVGILTEASSWRYD